MANPDNFKTIPQMYEYVVKEYGKAPRRQPIKIKVNGIFKGISYQAIKEEVENFAYGLLYLEIKRGEKISLISENRIEWIYSDFAILGIGAINVPIYPSLTAESIEYILKDSDSAGVIVSNQLHLNKILKIKDKCKNLKYIIILNEKEINKDVNNIYSFKNLQDIGKGFKKAQPNLFSQNISKTKEDDLCTIIYTSGTTGNPKGVMLSHKNIISNVISVVSCFYITSKDCFLSFLPFCHIYERTAGYYSAFSCGCDIYLSESIEAVAQNLIESKPTIMTGVPRLFERIYSRIIRNVESQPEKKQKIFNWAVEIGKQYQTAKKRKKIPAALSVKHKLADRLVFKKLRARTGGKLRFFASGGAPLRKDIAEFFEAVGILILEGYGLTEASPIISVDRPESYKFGTVGKPIPGVEVRFADDGEILVKGPNVMHGYYKNQKETKETIKDNWLHTGDIGFIDEENFLHITDRKKHLFKTSGGKYIAPAPIENLFQSSKYVDQFILIGDKRTFLTALIVPDFDALKEFADSHGIAYKENEDLVANGEIHSLIDKDINQLQRQLANFEKIRKFTILGQSLTVENGEITPSLKVKRKVIEEKFGDIIDKMYEGF
jgi:long-chain acyl-CoA synthetase